MNRRRELALQRVSRIGSIAAADNISQNTKYKNSQKSAHTSTIEAALGTYLMRENRMYDLRGEDTYVHGYGGSGSEAQGQLSRQMQEYVSMASAEESQLANAKSDLERRVAEHINIRKFEEALANDPSAQYQLNRYHRNDEETDFDRLDANRCSGFLLYSYNKKGVHSVLGEHLSFAGYETVGQGGNLLREEP
ncbi:MAG: hypothetical protein K2P39_10535 [Lachnospiraceae bacterium]|nr:hypothetical protein [Lachnospiraceae bacterium]MDE6985157.1 hypothetical protein [Lachnospiraceae bacterium]MDE7028982.1 hypothetical protein [Lachnospiraceae bacterium]